MVILEREKRQYNSEQIRQLLRQLEPHVGLISGKVELNGQQYFV